MADQDGRPRTHGPGSAGARDYGARHDDRTQNRDKAQNRDRAQNGNPAGGGDKPQRRAALDGKGKPVLMHPANAALLEYWHIVRDRERLANWHAFDLLEITPYLANLSLLEWTDDNRLIYRFAGTQLVEWMGADPTNQSLDAFGGVQQCLMMIPALSARALVLLLVEYRTRSGRIRRFEDLCMPLASPGHPARYILIGSQPAGRPEGRTAPTSNGESDPEDDMLLPGTFNTVNSIRLPLTPVEPDRPLIYAMR